MPTEIVPFAGWPHNVRLFNAEAIVTLDVGPRVTLAPGESATHRERWSQHVFDEALPLEEEAALADLLRPVVHAAGVL